MARQLPRLPAGNQEELLVAIRRDDLSATEVRQVVDLLLVCSTREERDYVLLKPREAIRVAAGGLARGSDPRLSSAGNRLAQRLATLLDGLTRMRNYLCHRCRAELAQQDRTLLRAELARLGRDVQWVAELSTQLAEEFLHESPECGHGE